MILYFETIIKRYLVHFSLCFFFLFPCRTMLVMHETVNTPVKVS